MLRTVLGIQQVLNVHCSSYQSKYPTWYLLVKQLRSSPAPSATVSLEEVLLQLSRPLGRGQKPSRPWLWPTALSHAAFLLGVGEERKKVRKSRWRQEWGVRLQEKTMGFVKSLSQQSGQVQWLQAT